MYGEKAWQEQLKNTASNIEQVLEVTPPQNSNCTPIYYSSWKTIKVWQTRHMGHCWRSKDKLISDVLLWTPSHGWAKVGWPARTYIQQLCADTGCSLEELLGAMDNRDRWQERVRENCADSATWWWWWLQCQSSMLATVLLKRNRD